MHTLLQEATRKRGTIVSYNVFPDNPPAQDKYAVAGRLLALSEAMRKAGEDGSYLPESLGRIVATHGVDAGRGWLEGYWYATGVRQHEVCVRMRHILNNVACACNV